MKTKKTIIGITGTFTGEFNQEEIKDLLVKAGFIGIELTTIPFFYDWAEGLPKESIPGLRQQCIDSMDDWRDDRIQYGIECCIKEAIEESDSDIPEELAKAIYSGTVDDSKKEYDIDAIELIIDLIEGAINKINTIKE